MNNDLHTLIPAYYNLNWCGLFMSIEIQSWYIQPKLNTFTIFDADISSRYRTKVNRNVVEISRNECSMTLRNPETETMTKMNARQLCLWETVII